MTSYIPLLETYLIHYTKDREGFTDMIGTLDVPKQVISALYEMFVYRKEIEPMETMNHDDKMKLWAKAISFSNVHKDRMMICKSIYLMENITNANKD